MTKTSVGLRYDFDLFFILGIVLSGRINCLLTLRTFLGSLKRLFTRPGWVSITKPDRGTFIRASI